MKHPCALLFLFCVMLSQHLEEASAIPAPSAAQDHQSMEELLRELPALLANSDGGGGVVGGDYDVMQPAAEKRHSDAIMSHLNTKTRDHQSIRKLLRMLLYKRSDPAMEEQKRSSGGGLSEDARLRTALKAYVMVAGTVPDEILREVLTDSPTEDQ